MLVVLLVTGLANGSLYALVALGLVVIYKATTVVNFAQGEAVMLGGFLAFTLLSAGFPYPAALILAVLLSLAIGMLTERIAYRPLSRASVSSLVLACVAFSFILKGSARVVWGGLGDYLALPPVFSLAPIRVGRFLLSSQHLIILAATLAIMAAFAAGFKWTKLGQMMQATADNQRAAALVGIRVERVLSLTWALGAGLGGAAGVLLAPLALLYPDMGTGLLVKAFAAAVLGGFGSLVGAAVGGLAIGLIENLAGAYVHTSLLDVSAMLVIPLVLLVRPTGLFGSPAIRKA